MLDEYTKVTCLHRKAAIRLLNRPSLPKAGKRCGRPAMYRDFIQPLRVIWEANDRVFSKRLQPFLPEMVKVLRQHGEQQIDARTEALLCRMSPSIIADGLQPYYDSIREIDCRLKEGI